MTVVIIIFFFFFHTSSIPHPACTIFEEILF